MEETTTADLTKNNTAVPFGVLAPLFLYFAGAGIATVMLGPLLPGLIARWHIQDAQAGILFTSFFSGQLTGAYIAARSLRASIVFGSMITSIGCIAMLWVNFDLAHVALFAIGFGIGAGLTAGNIIAGTAVRSSSRLLAMINVGWSLGAIACPTLIRIFGARWFFIITAIVVTVTALIASTLPLPPKVSSNDTGAPRLPLPIVPLLIFALALLLYIGVENTLGGWLPSYAVRNSALLLASSISFYFWVAELAGRALAAAILQKLSDSALYRASLVLLIGSVSLLAFVPSLSAIQITTLTILCGMAIAPLYPVIVASLLARTGPHPRLGLLFASASLGGVTLPWLTGISSTVFHSLRIGLIVPAIGGLLLLILTPMIARKQLSESPDSTIPAT